MKKLSLVLRKSVFSFLVILLSLVLLSNSYVYASNKVTTTLSVFDDYEDEITSNSDDNEDNTNEKAPAYLVEPTIYAESCILEDVDTGKILFEKNSNDKKYPASTTKLMTAIVVLDNVKDLNEKANVSFYAVHEVPYSYSSAELVPGESVTIKDLLDSLLIASANDSAFVLAEYVANGGNTYNLDESFDTQIAFSTSIAKFAAMMNDKAKELGCKNTNFVNPNGIHDNDHVTTAYDLALIGDYAYKNPEIRAIVVKQSGIIPGSTLYDGEMRTYESTNFLLDPDRQGYYEYANGLKTGYTDPAQNCIIASASKDNRNLICVILHSEKTDDYEKSREADCKRLFEYGFERFKVLTLIGENETAKTISIFNGTQDTKELNLVAEDSLNVLIKNNTVIDVTPDIKINKTIAPIAKGEVVGTITYVVHGETFTTNLLAEHDVEAFNLYLILIIMFGIFLICLLYIFAKKKYRKRRHIRYR